MGWAYRLTVLEWVRLFSETCWAVFPFKPFSSALIHASIPGPCWRWTAGFLTMTTRWFSCLPMRIPQHGFLLMRWEPSVQGIFFPIGTGWYMKGRMAVRKLKGEWILARSWILSNWAHWELLVESSYQSPLHQRILEIQIPNFHSVEVKKWGAPGPLAFPHCYPCLDSVICFT